jgi:hypothetical protein
MGRAPSHFARRCLQFRQALVTLGPARRISADCTLVVHGREQRPGESEDLGVGLKANLYPEAVETGADKAGR